MALAPLMLAHLADERAGTVEPRPFLPSDRPLHLLRPSRSEEPSARRRLAVIGGSLLAHLFFFTIAVQLPSFVGESEPERPVVIKRTPLYIPPDILTQRAPNKTKPTENIDLASLLSSEQSQAHKASPEASRKHFELPKQALAKPVANANPQILPEPPKVALNQVPGPLPPGAVSGIGAPAPPPPTPSQSPFQNVGTEAPPNPHPTITPPKATVQEAMKGVVRSGTSSHIVISDESLTEPSPATPGALRQTGGEHAAIELQSDPAGADFKAYLTRILGIVRGNWKRVIPESARMGSLRGRTVMEFIINRDGSIPKLVTAESSGLEPLDRAAIAGLSMSNPLPALPADYKGFQVRLAFTFSYNLPTQ